MKASISTVLALALSVSILLGSCGAASAAGPAVSVSSAVSTVKTYGGNDIYALTVSVDSPNGLSVMSVVMSYDKAVVIPVDKSTSADISGLSNGSSFRAVEPILRDRSETTPYSMQCFWYSGASRDAFLCDLFSTSPLTSMTTGQPAFRFLFRLAGGMTSDDLSADTFRIETDKSAGSILASIYTTPESLAGSSGLAITDKSPGGDTTHVYSPGAGGAGGVLDAGVTLIAAGSPETAPTIRFDDVQESDWFYAAVIFLAKRGITNGTGPTTFSPLQPLTRGQLLVLIMRAFEIAPDDGEGASNDNFADAGDTYYTGYLSAAKRLGIAAGIGDNRFAPDRACTRQEMFKLVYQALSAIEQLPEAKGVRKPGDFVDGSDIDAWAEESVGHLLSSGLISGTGGGRLDPLSGCSRAEMAQLLANLLRP